MSDNPYSAPLSYQNLDEQTTLIGREREPFREIVFSWEKYRLIYNAVLFVVGLFIMIPAWDLMGIASIFGCIAVGLSANACFMLGPVAELYVRAFVYPLNTRLLRRILFFAGLFVSIGFFALVALVMFFAPAEVGATGE